MKCLLCNTEIENNRKYCSISCKRKYLYRAKSSQLVCTVCGASFIGRAGEKCCSDECKLKAQRIHEKTCLICNSKFSSRGNGLYCSTQCYRKANSNKNGLISVNCKVCGESFRTKRNNPSLVCSSECNSKLFSVCITETLLSVFGTTNKKEIQQKLKDKFQKKGETNEQG